MDIDMNGDEEEEGLQVSLDDGSVQEILSPEMKVIIDMKSMWLFIVSMFLRGSVCSERRITVDFCET